jgi:hypothetical protein
MCIAVGVSCSSATRQCLRSMRLHAHVCVGERGEAWTADSTPSHPLAHSRASAHTYPHAVLCHCWAPAVLSKNSCIGLGAAAAGNSGGSSSHIIASPMTLFFDTGRSSCVRTCAFSVLCTTQVNIAVQVYTCVCVCARERATQTHCLRVFSNTTCTSHIYRQVSDQQRQTCVPILVNYSSGDNVEYVFTCVL